MSCPTVAGAKRYSCENRRLTTQLRLRSQDRSNQQAQGKPSQLAGVDQAARPKERNAAIERACTELQVSSTATAHANARQGGTTKRNRRRFPALDRDTHNGKDGDQGDGDTSGAHLKWLRFGPVGETG